MSAGKLTITDVRRVAARHGGRVQPDGCGGYEVLAPPDRRWINAEVQCYVLPLNEYEDDERQDELQRCIDMIEDGIEPFPD
jgi:hypothetical protein